jgi:hypothetical protein
MSYDNDTDEEEMDQIAAKKLEDFEHSKPLYGDTIRNYYVEWIGRP